MHGDCPSELSAQEKSDEQTAGDWTPPLDWSWNPLADNEQAIIVVSASNIIEELGDERSGQEGREGLGIILVVPVSSTDLCHTFPMHETALNQHRLPMRKMYFRRALLFRNENLNVGKIDIMYASDMSVVGRWMLTFTGVHRLERRNSY